MSEAPVIRHLGLVPYEPTWRAMQAFTDERGPSTPDEIWFVEHPAVFTLGLNASREHLLSPGEIPVVQIDRGGQVTYHGPGQLLVYPLIDVRRRRLSVRELVVTLENAVIACVADFGVLASGSREAPGVYVGGAKLASIGLRIRRGACYHGLALNVSLDLTPFERINVCGHPGLTVTRLADHVAGLAGEGAGAGAGAGVRAGASEVAAVETAAVETAAVETVARALTPHLLRLLKFTTDYSAINTDLQAVNSR
jgi:lipoyl(octanoyl) transferase